jgi:peroxiredoxin
MAATLYLLGFLLLPAQTADRGDWLLTPRLNRAQEMLYRGEYAEETLDSGARCLRKYKLENRLLVVGVTEHEIEIAGLALLEKKSMPAEGAPNPQPVSTRLEVVKFDNQGRMLSPNSAEQLAPLDAPPTIDWGFLVEVPKTSVGRGDRWKVREEGRPERSWEVAGQEAVNGITCVKLIGRQQSTDWEQPRGDRTGWQRTDTVWIAPRQGIVQQLERVILRRDPGRDVPTARLTVRYELDSSFQFSSDLFEHRLVEIAQARALWDSALPFLSNPGRYGPQLDALLGRIDYHLQKNSETPYREGILRVKRRLEAARRGEALVEPVQRAPLTIVETVGKPAPDFVAPNMIKPESVSFKQWGGKPLVLVFYDPAARSTGDVLPYAQMLAKKYPQANVLGMAMSDEREQVQKQLADLKVDIAVLSGTGLRHAYNVETTPKFVVIDANGVVRESYLGWGIGVRDSVFEELRKCATPRQ